MMNARLVQPAADAREAIKPVKKVIKKRNDRRLDYERSQDKVNSLSKKDRKSPRDIQAYSKAQEDLSNFAEVCSRAVDGTFKHRG
jgi:amphiphysin